MIRQVMKYKTSDNKEWDDKGLAKAHENELNAKNELNRLLAAGLRSAIGPDGLIKQILMEAPMVFAVLKDYLKGLPKQEIETVTVLARAA